jgi:hypothetical protein
MIERRSSAVAVSGTTGITNFAIIQTFLLLILGYNVLDKKGDLQKSSFVDNCKSPTSISKGLQTF